MVTYHSAPRTDVPVNEGPTSVTEALLFSEYANPSEPQPTHESPTPGRRPDTLTRGSTDRRAGVEFVTIVRLWEVGQP
jgi:hypothetical protein